MPVKRDYSAFSSLHCSMKMPMWRTSKVLCTIIRNLDFQKLASLLLATRWWQIFLAPNFWGHIL